jgi:hypothetical protein
MSSHGGQKEERVRDEWEKRGKEGEKSRQRERGREWG